MLKKIIVIAALLLLVGFSAFLLYKTDNARVKNNQDEPVKEAKLPDTLFVFSKDTLSEDCSQSDEQFCAVENAVKCTINPNLNGCSEANLPKFIFMQDPGLDRPTEISYKIVNRRVLVNNNVEIHTESSCNGGWFGLCQGTVIYVLSEPDGGKWFVKDIYAIE